MLSSVIGKRLVTFSLVALFLTTFAFAQTPAPAPAPAKSAPKAHNATAAPAMAPLDINTASKDELVALPDIGDTYAQKIIDNRPYKRKDELVSKKVLPAGVYKKVSSHLIAKQ